MQQARTLRGEFSPVVDASIRWVNAVPTLIAVAAVVGITYWGDRTYRRWLKESHPLKEHRARLDRLKTGYRARRTSLTEVAQFVGDVLEEVARATSTGHSPMR
jgi:hypothetical protein